MTAFRTLLYASVTTVFFISSGFGQPSHPPRQTGKGHERLEGVYHGALGKYKKMRLIEALDLKEEDAARFVAKYNTHEKNIRDLMEERKEVISELEQLIEKKGSDKDYEKLFARLDDNGQKVFGERKRFHSDIKSMMTTEQMARFFVFDRHFNRELGEAMKDIRRERWRR